MMSPINPLATIWFYFWRRVAILLPRRWTTRIMVIAVRPWTAKGWGLARETCMFCGFFGSIKEDDSEGVCRKFCVRRQEDAMGLLRRRQGELPSPDALPLIVGGGFVCGDFQSKFKPPPLGDPLRHFWAQPLDE